MISKKVKKPIGILVGIMVLFLSLHVDMVNAESPASKVQSERVPVCKIIFLNNKAIDSKTLLNLIKEKYPNYSEFCKKGLTCKQINDLANIVLDAYLEKRYLMVKVNLPECGLNDPCLVQEGKLVISISEGEIGEVKVVDRKSPALKKKAGRRNRITGASVPAVKGLYYSDRVLTRYFNPQIKSKVINESLLERGALLAKEVQGVNTDLVIVPHQQKKNENKAEPVKCEDLHSCKEAIEQINRKAPRKFDLLLATEMKKKFPYEFSLDYNNFGIKNVSRSRYGFLFKTSDPWWGSELMLRGSTGDYWGDTNLAAVDYAVPLNGYGTKIDFNYLYGDYIVGGQTLSALELNGDTNIYGAGLEQPLIRTKNKNLYLKLDYRHKRVNQYILTDELFHRDEVDTYGASLNFDLLESMLRAGKDYLSVGFVYGNINKDDDSPPSTVEADDNFFRVSMDMTRIQYITENMNLMLRASGQYSGDRMPITEQWFLGGYASVRGHEPSSYIGDSGYVLSGELVFNPPLIGDFSLGLFGKQKRISDLMQLDVFYDTGGVFVSDHLFGEKESVYLAGYGLGIRLFYEDRFDFKFDAGFPTNKKERDKDYYPYVMAEYHF